MDHPKHALNAPGDFYVEDGLCISCTAPEHVAPDLISHFEDGEIYHCYFAKQPTNAEETTRAIRAVQVGCCGAVRYGGSDPTILRRLVKLGSSEDCDLAKPHELLKAKLERMGELDSLTNERARRMLNITRDTGELLAVLVRATAARRVLEIGTSNGYSTLWLAEAAKDIGGSVTTLEFAEYKIQLAADNFARSGLAPFITLVHEDAGRFLERCEPSAYDLIFLDSERTEYPGWWPHLRRALRPGGLLVVDNAMSHPQEMAPLVALLTADPEFTTSLIPVGKGEFLAVKAS